VGQLLLRHFEEQQPLIDGCADDVYYRLLLLESQRERGDVLTDWAVLISRIDILLGLDAIETLLAIV
jgi:hypothetical protein